MSMDKMSFSMEMRDVMKRMVEEEVDRLRPKYRYATVHAIDRVKKKCDVIYTGETEPVRVNMGSIQPASTGQVVRIEGIGVDKFVSDVIGESYEKTHTHERDPKDAYFDSIGDLHIPGGAYVAGVGPNDSAVPNRWAVRDMLNQVGLMGGGAHASPSYVAGWAPFGNGWMNAVFTRIGKSITISGMMTNQNAFSGVVHTFWVPNGWAPKEPVMTSVTSMGVGVMRFDINTNGACYLHMGVHCPIWVGHAFEVTYQLP